MGGNDGEAAGCTAARAALWAAVIPTISGGSGSPVLPDPVSTPASTPPAELPAVLLPPVVLPATTLPLVLPAPVPLLALGPELPAVLPELPAALPVLAVVIAVAPSGVPKSVDVCVSPQADRAPSASAKHETGIEKAALFIMINPGAGMSARLQT
jgi:hypothetical protein